MKLTFGLIGYPVKHSLSALMHNAAFKHLGIDAEYKLFEVKPDKLKKFFDNFKADDISGINITIPYKTRSMIFCDDLSDEAKLMEAINTIALKGDRLVGYNTDGRGFIKSLREDLGFNPKGKVAFVFGAGGAGKAVSFSLALQGVSRIILVDIDTSKAAILAKTVEKKTDIEVIAVERDARVVKELILNSDLVVNATPSGMKEADTPLLPEDFLHKGLAVFDLVYNRKTPLIRQAEKKKIKSVDGLGMLVYQGAASFELWTGKAPPIEVMRKALKC